jgi:two-component system sensor histidine kinase KdpD
VKWRAYLLALGAVAGATVLGSVAGESLALADDVMLYLLAIMIAAIGGRGAGAVAAALSVAAYDFFFVPPRFTFAIADLHHLMTFAVMFAVGIAIGTLVQRLRHAREAELRARAEELRSQLLATVSHDLRTPLAIITGMATSVREGAPELPAQQLEALDTIVDEARRLGAILTNLLAITRVQSGGAPRREWVPVEELVGATLDRLDAQLVGRDVAIAIEPDVGVNVDAVLTEQMLLNVIENATKHTPAGTPIEIRARRAADGVAIEIADRGPGLPPGPREQVFEKFFRGPGTRTAGAGLGLTVCRGIATAHGGRIEAEQRDGGGAVFRVWLPGGLAPEAAAEPVGATA